MNFVYDDVHADDVEDDDDGDDNYDVIIIFSFRICGIYRMFHD